MMAPNTIKVTPAIFLMEMVSFKIHFEMSMVHIYVTAVKGKTMV